MGPGMSFMNMPLDKAAVVIAFGSLIREALIGLGWCGVIIRGLRQMRRQSDEWDRRLEQQAVETNVGTKRR